MEKFMMGFLIGIGSIVLVALLALIGGTIVYWVWPTAIPAAFPGLIASGAIASKLSWWQAVCLTWLFGILIKSTQTTTNNNS
jgi:hypothetical protein